MLRTNSSSEPDGHDSQSQVAMFRCFEYVHAEDARSTPDVEDNLVLEDVAILVDGVTV